MPLIDVIDDKDRADFAQMLAALPIHVRDNLQELLDGYTIEAHLTLKFVKKEDA